MTDALNFLVEKFRQEAKGLPFKIVEEPRSAKIILVLDPSFDELNGVDRVLYHAAANDFLTAVQALGRPVGFEVEKFVR